MPPMPPEDSASNSPSPESGPQRKAPRKTRRGWFRRFLRILLVLLILVAVFHRPLFHTGMRWLLIKVASRQNVTLNVKFAGNIFTNLDVRDVTAYPTGAGPSPVEKITIESVHLEYSIPRLLRTGVGYFLESYEIKNADLRLLAYPSKDEAERKQKRTLAQDLNNLLAQPALYADRVKVENFNIKVTSPKDVTEVQGVNLFLDPEKIGYLRIERVKIPRLPEWKNLAAETSYAARNLFLRNLVLEPGKLVVKEFNFDASQQEQKRGSVLLDLAAFDGSIQLELHGARLPKKGETLESSYATDLKIEAAAVDLAATIEYFARKRVEVGRLESLKLAIVGEPERPRTWTGNIAASVTGPRLGKLASDRVTADLAIEQGRATLRAAEARIGQNVATATGAALLPEKISEFSQTDGDVDVKLNAGDLLEITKPFMTAQPIGGTATGSGRVGIHGYVASADFTLSGENVGNEQYGAGKAEVAVRGYKALKPDRDSLFSGLRSEITAHITDLRYKTFTADTAQIEAGLTEESATFRSVRLVRGENEVSFKGGYRINPNGDPLAGPLETDFTVKVPDLAAFGLRVKEAALTGSITGQGSLKSTSGKINGQIDIEGTKLALGDFETRRLGAKVTVADDRANIEELRLQISENDQVASTGNVVLKQPYAYEGAVLVLMKDLAVLQPLLAIFGTKENLSGAVDFSIEGKGAMKPQAHEGQVNLAVTNAKYGQIDLKEVSLAGLYDPQFAESTKLRVVSGITSLEGVLEWRDAKLKLRDINLQQGTQQAFTGFVIIPFDPRKAENMVELDKRIAANVNARELDIEKLLASLGQKSPVAGVVTANLVAGGTFLRPTAHLRVSVKKLRSPSASQIDPAELDFTAHYAERELTLDATLRQRQIQPLTVKGTAPLDLEGTLQQKKFDPDLPLDLTVRLPQSSLAFLSNLAPAIRRVDGTAAIDAKVSGTVANPQFTGNASVRVASARLKNESIPPIGGLVADLSFANDGMRVRTLRGEIGGGTFQVTGGVAVPRWFEPIFDLRLRSDDVLVRRDESVTVRVDTDVAATGPLKAGSVKGTVWLTQSRFFREIDILPIGLPGRPKPKPAPKAVETAQSFSIDVPPFRDWTFDIAIKTRPDDPFQIRGNLANGSAAADLTLGGTGLTPYLEGVVRVDNFVASLPFSKLNVTRGFITFSRDAPFEPTLDILANSDLRNYRITAYIYGSSKDPQLSLTSEPPLPQQDIISLLATGTTTSELTGSSDVLAGRAAVLLFQQLYRKIFKQRDAAEGVPLLDRFDVDIGAVDERTGRQEISATLRLGENFYLVGDVDVSGEFAGRIRYLIRFR